MLKVETALMTDSGRGIGHVAVTRLTELCAAVEPGVPIRATLSRPTRLLVRGRTS